MLWDRAPGKPKTKSDLGEAPSTALRSSAAIRARLPQESTLPAVRQESRNPASTTLVANQALTPVFPSLPVFGDSCVTLPAYQATNYRLLPRLARAVPLPTCIGDE